MVRLGVAMAKDPAFLFYPGDYLRDTQLLSEKTQVSYDRIMCEHMRNICISQKQLNFLTKKLNEDELDELMMVLVKIDGGFHISWVSESISKRKAYSESRRSNRKGKVKEDMINTSLSYDSHMENENENEDVVKSKSKKETEPAYKKFYREQWDISNGNPLASKYQHIIKYIMNIDKNDTDEPGEHILKLKKQLSYEQFITLHSYCEKRATSIKEMIDSWLNKPSYSNGRVSVYACLRKWASKAPMAGTNFQDNKKPIMKTSIGKV